MCIRDRTLAQAIRDRGIATPIVLLTSNPAAARGAAGAQHLAATLQKPILRADLYRRLQSLAGTTEPAAPDSAVAVVERRHMRVLTAEDNRTNQLVFQKMVRDMNIDLVFANNGEEAVALFGTFQPCLLYTSRCV